MDSASEQSPIVIQDEKDKQGALILIIAFSVLGGVVALYAIRYKVLKKTQEKLDAQRDIHKIEENKKKEEAQITHEMSDVKNFNTESKINQGDAYWYKQQYDPNNDFAIFGVGNKAMGGFQDMNEKMNKADDKHAPDSSSDDEGEHAKSVTHLNSSGSLGKNKIKTPPRVAVKNQLPEDKEVHSLTSMRE